MCKYSAQALWKCQHLISLGSKTEEENVKFDQRHLLSLEDKPHWHDDLGTSGRSWNETMIVVFVGGILLLLMTWPVFKSYFFAENFLYLGMYQSHGNSFWRALFSPSDNIFFRPILYAFSLPWYFILPLDPLAYHLRNFGFSMINLLLFYRVLVRLVASLKARWIAFFFFVLSKIHLTIIGYINIFDSAVLLMLLLASVLFFLRYIASQRAYDYCLGLLFVTLSIFSKDYGLVVVGVMMALVVSYGTNYDSWPEISKSDFSWWWKRLLPLPLVVIVYLALRYAIIGPLPSDNPVYSPQFSLSLITGKVWLFTTTLWNISFVSDGTMGADGLGTALAAKLSLPWMGKYGINWIFYWLFMAILLMTLVIGRRGLRRLILPLVWIVAYLGPTLLVRNINIYYYYEPIAGTAILVGLCLDHNTRRWLLLAWGLALVLIGINGALSNNNPEYHWSYTAGKTQMVQKTLIEAFRGQPIKSVTFASSSLPFWQYALTSDGKGPMLEKLMNLPKLKVRFTDYTQLEAKHQAEGSSADLFFDVDNGFKLYDANQDMLQATPAGTAKQSVLALSKLYPAATRTGSSFNVQPSGESALSLYCTNATPNTVVVFDNTPLATTYGNSSWVTALVPRNLYAKPGRYRVLLKNGAVDSNQLEFVVEP
jgi:hypothetical protein